MTNLQKMQQWLQTYPGWEGRPIAIDFTYATPVGLGLYSRGREEESSREDILGRKEFRCRFRFLLQLNQFGRNGAGEQVTAFQEWVAQQSALGLTPRFGDAPEQEKMTSRLQQVKKSPNAGTELLAVELTAEFIKIY